MATAAILDFKKWRIPLFEIIMNVYYKVRATFNYVLNHLWNKYF